MTKKLIFHATGWLCLLLGAAMLRAAATPAEILGSNGLEKVGATYVLPAEVEILHDMPEFHKVKKVADEDKRTRKMYEARIASSRKLISTGRRELDDLDDRQKMAQSVNAHNRIVMRMNQLIVKMKEASRAQQDCEEKVSKLSSENEVQYVDQVLALNAKVDVIMTTYDTLAADTSVKKAIDRLNLAGAGSNIKLGPGDDFASTVTELRKLMSEINSEAIPLEEDHGVFKLTAMLNGQSFKMCLDSGSTSILLPGDIAQKLNIVPGPKDQIVQMKMADGTMIQGQQMTLKNVRVGRFTVSDVGCVVLMNRNSQQAEPLLGNSFLSHFVAKLDQKAATLHLTESEPEKPAAGKITATKTAGTPEKLP